MNTSRSRRARNARRSEWVRPFRRLQRVLDSSARLIGSSWLSMHNAERCARRRPVRTAQSLNGAVRNLRDASTLVLRAAADLAEVKECLDRQPENGDAPQLLEWAAERWLEVSAAIQETLGGVVLMQMEVLGGLATGELVPERPGRPRIVPVPRPLFVRAFLAARRPRVSDRITPILRRRRRTPRPAAIRVPRRNVRGRAPPLLSLCSL